MEDYAKLVQLILAGLMMIAVMEFMYHHYLKLAPAGLMATGSEKKNREWIYITVLLVIGLVVKLVLAGNFKGFEADMNCFKFWGQRMLEVGPGKMYSSDYFTDYPPGYLYVLGAVAWICRLFGIDTASAMGDMIFKMPACLCDLAAGFLIYKIAIKKLPKSIGVACAALYIFNPAIMINSSVWGQVDSVYVLFLVLMCYFIVEKKLPIAYIFFGIGVLIKPQMAIFFPVLLWGIIEQVFLDDYNKKKFLLNLGSGLGAIVLMVLLAIPFGLSKVISQFLDTVSSYPYTSVNAYNMWTIFGKNWSSQTTTFLHIQYAQWGTIFIVLIMTSAIYLFYRARKDQSKYFFAAAYIMAGVFVFSVRMHERYMYPVLIMLLLAYVMKPTKHIFYAYMGMSVVHLINVGHVFYYYDANNFSAKAMVPVMTGAATLGVFIYLVYTAYRWYFRESEETEKELESENRKVKDAYENPSRKKLFPDEIRPTAQPLKMCKLDILILLVIVGVYSFIALYDLGERKTPNTEWLYSDYNATITLDLGESKTVSKFAYYLGNYEKRNVTVQYSDTGAEGDWKDASSFEMTSVMCWGEQSVSATGRYVRMSCTNNALSLFEIALLDSDGKIIEPVNADEYSQLFDEQDKYEERTFRNSTYFDEIYHARTAYEYITGRYCYENTHPPLGKVLIAFGMIIFGVCPFGWRIMGVLFGIAMLPFIYLLAKKLFKETWISAVITTLFAFDFMHFAQTRIATIDVYVTFFIILMYFFMYCYTQRSFYDRPIMRTWGILALSGISMGLGIASKWTGVYAGAGLGVVFFVDYFRRFKEYRFAKTNVEGKTNGISHKDVIRKFPNYTFNTFLVCLIFFVFVPILIYIAAYIPFSDGSGKGLIAMMLKNQETMFSYHSKLVSTHPYSSTWYQWPFMYRPIFYYSRQISDTVSEGISAFGNPFVWYAGVPALVYMFYLLFKQKDKKAMFLLIGYFAQYLPWMLVTRTTYIYHYFTSVPFVTLMVGYSIFKIVGHHKNRRKWAYLYVLGALILFALFYPVLSGHAVSVEFVNRWLKWFDHWTLIL